MEWKPFKKKKKSVKTDLLKKAELMRRPNRFAPPGVFVPQHKIPNPTLN